MSKCGLVIVLPFCVFFVLSCTKSSDSSPPAANAATTSSSAGTMDKANVGPSSQPVVEASTFLHDNLVNTTYAWNGENVTLTFRDDGTIGMRNWEDRHLVTRWKPIDRRTILLIIDKGREENRYAVLTFSEDLASYSGYNFEHASALALSRKK